MTKWKKIAAATGAGMLAVGGLAVSLAAGAGDIDGKTTLAASYTNNGGTAFIVDGTTPYSATCPTASTTSTSDYSVRQNFVYTLCQ